MKKTILTILASMVATTVLWLVLGAALPAPIWRNNFSTNQPPFPIIGTWTDSNSVVNAGTNMFVVDNTGIWQVPPNAVWSPIWKLFGAGTSGFAFQWGPFGNSTLNTNASATIAVDQGSMTALDLYYGGTGPQSVPAFAIHDASGVTIGQYRTNHFWATTNDFFATFTSTDNTTNNIFTFTPRVNSAVRVMADIVAYNATNSASYGKIATFRNVAGVVTQVGVTATLGQAEDVAADDALFTLSGATVQVQVAGTGATINWVCYVKLIYWQ